jgi:hypothetical protein
MGLPEFPNSAISQSVGEIHVTEHAVDRYCEQVENVPREVVRARIIAAARGIHCAVRFGGRCVILGNGARLIISADVDQGVRVVTVLGRGQWVREPRDFVEQPLPIIEGTRAC